MHSRETGQVTVLKERVIKAALSWLTTVGTIANLSCTRTTVVKNFGALSTWEKLRGALDVKRTRKKWQLYRWRNHRSHRSQSIEYKNHRRHPSQSIRVKNHRRKELRCLEHVGEALWCTPESRDKLRWFRQRKS